MRIQGMCNAKLEGSNPDEDSHRVGVKLWLEKAELWRGKGGLLCPRTDVLLCSHCVGALRFPNGMACFLSRVCPFGSLRPVILAKHTHTTIKRKRRVQAFPLWPLASFACSSAKVEAGGNPRRPGQPAFAPPKAAALQASVPFFFCRTKKLPVCVTEEECGQLLIAATWRLPEAAQLLRGCCKRCTLRGAGGVCLPPLFICCQERMNGKRQRPATWGRRGLATTRKSLVVTWCQPAPPPGHV